MIFTAKQTRQILTGRKTQVRRPARTTATINGATHNLDTTTPSEHQLHFTRHRVGRIYPLERPAGRDEMTIEQALRASTGQRPRPVTVAHLQCTALHLERLGSITLRDALAEGFDTTLAFKANWARTHRRAQPARARTDKQLAELIHRMSSGTHNATPPPLLDCQIEDCDAPLHAFNHHHAHRLVWAITFQLHDAPRLLARTPTRGDYTTRQSLALDREPEAIPAHLQDHYSRNAREHDRTSGGHPAQTAVETIRRELANLRNHEHGTIIQHRQIQREISRLERTLANLERNLSGRLLS